MISGKFIDAFYYLIWVFLIHTANKGCYIKYLFHIMPPNLIKPLLSYYSLVSFSDY